MPRLFLPHLTLFALGGGRWLFWPRSLASLLPLGGGGPPLFEPHVVGQYNRLHTAFPVLFISLKDTFLNLSYSGFPQEIQDSFPISNNASTDVLPT